MSFTGDIKLDKPVFYHRASETERLEMQHRVIRNNATSFSELAQQLGVDMGSSDDDDSSDDELSPAKNKDLQCVSQTAAGSHPPTDIAVEAKISGGPADAVVQQQFSVDKPVFYHRASEAERLEMQHRVVRNNATSFSEMFDNAKSPKA
jgi:hypothetical protein